MTIRQKLGWSVGALVLATTVLGCVSWNAVASLTKELDVAIHKSAVKLDLVQSVGKRMQERLASTRGAALADVTKNTVQAEAARKKRVAAAIRIAEMIQEALPLFDAEGAGRIRSIETLLAEQDDQQKRYLEMSANQGVEESAAFMTEQIVPFTMKLEAALLDLVKYERQILKESSERAVAIEAVCRRSIVGLLGLTISICIIVIFVIEGINRTLKRSIHELTGGASQVASAAAHISASSQALAQGASKQAASIQQTHASSQCVHSTARQNEQNSLSANAMVLRSSNGFTTTNQSLNQLVIAMEEIGESSRKVAKIIRVIDEIAFQTNILALNAAVEAARAGIAGLGFAVVAEEVRNLSHRCSQAAKDTSDLISESIAKSTDGQERVGVAAAAFQTIRAESTQVRDLIEQVSAASRSQSQGIEEVSRSLLQIEHVTQNSAANAEEGAAAAEELNAQSASLLYVAEQLGSLVGETH